MSQPSSQHPFDAGGHSRLTEAELLAYLEGRLSAADARRVEELLSEEGMDSDAAEGLMELPIAETEAMVQQLNLKMQRQLKGRRQRRKQDTQLWTWVAVLIILILIAAGYYLLHLLGTK